MLLHVLGHVDLDEGVLRPEHEARQGPGEVRLAHARGAQEDEGGHGTVRILQPGARTAHGPADGGDGLVLADDHLVDLVLHLQKALGLLGLEARDGDARHLADDRADDVFVHDGFALLGIRAPLRLDVRHLLPELLRAVPQAGGALEVLLRDGFVLVLVELADLLLGLLEVGRGRHAAQANAGPRLVDDVDGLVGQVPSGDVPGGQLDGVLERRVGNCVTRLNTVNHREGPLSTAKQREAP